MVLGGDIQALKCLPNIILSLRDKDIDKKYLMLNIMSEGKFDGEQLKQSIVDADKEKLKRELSADYNWVKFWS